MRKFSLSYAAALSLAHESRPQITPNTGFEKQLRIWAFCEHDVFVSSLEDEGPRKEKPAYKAWKAERDNVLTQGEEDINRARFSSLAQSVASFGRRRMEQGEGKGEGGHRVEQDLETSLTEVRRRMAWARVREMEEDANQKLMNGIS